MHGGPVPCHSLARGMSGFALVSLQEVPMAGSSSPADDDIGEAAVQEVKDVEQSPQPSPAQVHSPSILSVQSS